MKRILSLLMVLLLMSPALAEVVIPDPVPSQAELQDAFLANLNGFFYDGTGAMDLTATRNGEPILTSTLTETEELFDVAASFNGQPLHLQLTQEGLYVELDGRCYALLYQDLAQALSALSGRQVITFDHTAAMNLANALTYDVILPALSYEATEEGNRVSFDLSGESLAVLGDKLMGDSQTRSLLTAMLQLPDPEAAWQQLRDQLVAGEIPFELHAQLTTEDAAQSIRLDADLFGLAAELTATVDGSGTDFNLSAGALTGFGHMDENGQTLHAQLGPSVVDLTTTPEGLTLDVDASPVTFDLSVDEKTAAGSLIYTQSAYVQPDPAQPGSMQEVQILNGSFNFDRTTQVLTGTAQLYDGTLAQLQGQPEEESYRTHLTLAAQGSTYAAADCLYTNTDQVFALDVSTIQADDSVASLDFACAKATGAFSLQVNALDGSSVSGEGVIGWVDTHGHLTLQQDGRVYSQVDFSCVNDRQHFTVTFETDALVDQDMVRIFEFYVNVDKAAGTYVGTCWTSRDRLEVQGQLSESLFRLKASSLRTGSLEATAYRDGDAVIGSASGSLMTYGSFSGNVLWSPSAKSLSYTTTARGWSTNLNASLVQDVNGAPMDLRFNYVNPARPMNRIDLRVNPAGIYLGTGNAVTKINWRAQDENTFVVTVVSGASRYSGAVAVLTVTVEEDRLVIQAQCGEETYELKLEGVEPQDIAPLSDQAAETITPEVLDALLSGLTGDRQ